MSEANDTLGLGYKRKRALKGKLTLLERVKHNNALKRQLTLAQIVERSGDLRGRIREANGTLGLG